MKQLYYELLKEYRKINVWLVCLSNFSLSLALCTGLPFSSSYILWLFTKFKLHHRTDWKLQWYVRHTKIYRLRLIVCSCIYDSMCAVHTLSLLNRVSCSAHIDVFVYFVFFCRCYHACWCCLYVLFFFVFITIHIQSVLEVDDIVKCIVWADLFSSI